MTIPFLNLFQKAKERWHTASASTPASARALPAEKSSNEKLSKTVMPNSTRTIAPLDPFQVASGGAIRRPVTGAPTRAMAPAPRMSGLPPVVALALEPKVERTISLQLSDFIGEIPPGYIKPSEISEASRRILVKASEVEKGMAAGKPTVSLASVYEQVPEIFLRVVAPSETTTVPVPFDKVMEQFSNVRVRSDQQRDLAVPQVQTPILDVTLEDTAKFGTTMTPLETSALPPVKVEHASAQAFSQAEPESVASGPVPPPPTRSTSTPPPPSTFVPPPDPSKPVRIPFHLPPNGTGASAPERVPASSGPPVPTRSPDADKPKVKPPSDDLRRQTPAVPVIQSEGEFPSVFAPPPKSKPGDDAKITLSLLTVLQNIPSFQLSGNTSSVPEDARIRFSISMIQPQLATGRVAIPPKQFQMAMPPQYRDLLVIDPSETPVMLPLQEVLAALPNNALKMRTDQEEVEKAEMFETPFSLKAKEDAERFKVAPAPVTKSETIAEKKIETEKAPDKIDIVPAQKTERLDAKEVVSRAMKLAGVAGCSITFADGLIIAGKLPEEVALEGLCAMAPSLLQRIEKHMLDTNLGALKSMTLHGDKSAVTFFMSGNICLTALHADVDLGATTQNQLAAMTKELSQTYAQPEKTHVDH